MQNCTTILGVIDMRQRGISVPEYTRMYDTHVVITLMATNVCTSLA